MDTEELIEKASVLIDGRYGIREYSAGNRIHAVCSIAIELYDKVVEIAAEIKQMKENQNEIGR